MLTDNYARGVNGFSINQEKSFKWCRLAAEEGSSLAQFGLCGKYIRGEGVAKSMDEAVKWCKLSADNGNAEASKYLCELIYSRDIEQGRLNDEDSLENMIKLYESGFTQCSVSLQLSLLQNAREKAKGEVQEDLLKSIEYFKQLFDMNGSYITLYYHQQCKGVSVASSFLAMGSSLLYLTQSVMVSHSYLNLQSHFCILLTFQFISHFRQYCLLKK